MQLFPWKELQIALKLIGVVATVDVRAVRSLRMRPQRARIGGVFIWCAHTLARVGPRIGASMSAEILRRPEQTESDNNSDRLLATIRGVSAPIHPIWTPQ